MLHILYIWFVPTETQTFTRKFLIQKEGPNVHISLIAPRAVGTLLLSNFRLEKRIVLGDKALSKFAQIQKLSYSH